MPQTKQLNNTKCRQFECLSSIFLESDLCVKEHTWQYKCPHNARTATTGRVLQAQQTQAPDLASVCDADFIK